VKVVVAPNAFKGSLTATQAAHAMALGVRDVFPQADVVQVPVADGGDGTVEALVSALHGDHRTAGVEGPLGDPVQATYGLTDHGRMGVVELASTFPLTPNVLNLIADVKPSLSPPMMERAMRALIKKEYDGISYKVLNIGAANLLPAYSTEIGVPMDGRHIEAAEALIRVAAECRNVGDVYQSSPISFRFVRASGAYMSMMQGRDTMMIELIQLNRSDGGYELNAAYEKALNKLGGRPHWGQVNTLTASEGLLETMYPHYHDWLEVYSRLNASCVFNSPFTERVGISTPRFTR